MVNFIFVYLIDAFVDVIEAFIAHEGTYAPILLLILEESGIPLPVPGDILIAYTGYKISVGLISYAAAFISILISVLIGSSILYYLSARFGQKILKKFGPFLHINDKKLLLVEKEFKKYGPLVIVFGRHIPGFRVPITIFSGMSKVGYGKFILSTFISIILWIGFYLGVGQRLGKRTINLLHGHHLYFLIVFIPFILFLGSLVYSYLRPRVQE